MLAAFSRANGFRTARKWFASVCFVAVPLAANARAAAPPAPQAFGAWEGPWDWSCQILGFAPGNCWPNPIMPMCTNPPPNFCPLLEFAHAALIPTGRHRGKVLLWRNESLWCCPGSPGPRTTETWLFDPVLPENLIKVEQNAPLDANLFCSGHSWDEHGRLVVAGGPTFSGSAIARSSYRFLPTSLRGVVTPPGGYPRIPASTIGDPWLQLGDIAVKRWYPTVMTLNKELIPEKRGNNACDNWTTPGSATLAFGGAFDQTNAPPSCQITPCAVCDDCPECMKGHETWERLAGTQWMCPLIPVGMPTHIAGGQTNPRHPDPFGQNVESYVETSLPPPSPPYQRFIDSYPRAFQLSALSGQEIFVAFDTNSGKKDPNTSPPNLSWVMKVPYVSTQPSNQDWDLRMAPSSPTPVGHSGDRYYGNAVVLHTRNGGLLLPDRVIVLNGAQACQDIPTPNTKILEFIPAGNPSLTGTWIDKATLPSGAATARVFSNAVVLPTGQILVVGGEDGVTCAPQPYLVDIGVLRNAPATITPLPVSSNNHPRTGLPTPRYYHGMALLLPDGGVFFAGGDDDQIPAPCTTPGTTLAASYSGEVYSPPYMFSGSRPHIDSAPADQQFSDTMLRTFNLTVVSEVVPSKVVLLRPASVTHFFDADQRYIELEAAYTSTGPGEFSVTVTSPTPDLGPAGWYMLFVVAPVEVTVGSPPIHCPSVAHFMRFY